MSNKIKRLTSNMIRISMGILWVGYYGALPNIRVCKKYSYSRDNNFSVILHILWAFKCPYPHFNYEKTIKISRLK